MTVIFKLTKNFKRYANADWIMVTKRGKILTAPVKFSAADFLRQYAGNQTDESASVFVCNFIRLLDVAIGKTLLYQQERLHYASLDKSPGAAALYGPEVLIRFFGIDTMCAPSASLVSSHCSSTQHYLAGLQRGVGSWCVFK